MGERPSGVTSIETDIVQAAIETTRQFGADPVLDEPLQELRRTQPNISLAWVESQMLVKDEAERAAKLLGAEIDFFDCGDYPLKLNERHFDRMVDIYRELNPSFVLTHALEDPYNFDHPDAAHFAQQTRVVAQAMGHKPDAKYQYAAPPVNAFFRAERKPKRTNATRIESTVRIVRSFFRFKLLQVR